MDKLKKTDKSRTKTTKKKLQINKVKFFQKNK